MDAFIGISYQHSFLLIFPWLLSDYALEYMAGIDKKIRKTTKKETASRSTPSEGSSF